MEKVNKFEILQEIVSALNVTIQNSKDSMMKTNELINDAPGAMQSHSDTSRTQLTSVLNASHQSLVENEKSLNILRVFSRENLDKINFETIKTGALIKLEKNGVNIENYFFLPTGAGIKIEYRGTEITSITPTSPLGKLLLNRRSGDDILFNIKGISNKIRILEIL